MKLGKLQRKWVNSLKAHPERQFTRSLGIKTDDGYRACCLGEAGLIMGSCFFISNGYLVEKGSHDNAILFKSYQKIGLRSPNGEIEFEDVIGLADLNDDPYHTWTEIAYLIEAAPELFFTKSV